MPKYRNQDRVYTIPHDQIYWLDGGEEITHEGEDLFIQKRITSELPERALIEWVDYATPDWFEKQDKTLELADGRILTFYYAPKEEIVAWIY